MPFSINIITSYPEMFSYLDTSLLKRGLSRKLWHVNIVNIRDFAVVDKYKKVDDKIFGGGKGLILRADIVGKALDSLDLPDIKEKGSALIYPTPKGKIFNQALAKSFSLFNNLTFLCGHFEGIDQRVLDYYNPLEVSLGDYIVSGGEIATLVMLDAILRLVPGMVSSYESVCNETFKDNLLEEPHYTKPRVWKELGVPEVLLTGNHKAIKEWRYKESLKLTHNRRKDLWVCNNDEQSDA